MSASSIAQYWADRARGRSTIVMPSAGRMGRRIQENAVGIRDWGFGSREQDARMETGLPPSDKILAGRRTVFRLRAACHGLISTRLEERNLGGCDQAGQDWRLSTGLRTQGATRVW